MLLLQKEHLNVAQEKAGIWERASNCWPEAKSVTWKWIMLHQHQHKELIWTSRLAFCLTFAHV